MSLWSAHYDADSESIDLLYEYKPIAVEDIPGLPIDEYTDKKDVLLKCLEEALGEVVTLYDSEIYYDEATGLNYFEVSGNSPPAVRVGEIDTDTRYYRPRKTFWSISRRFIRAEGRLSLKHLEKLEPGVSEVYYV